MVDPAELRSRVLVCPLVAGLHAGPRGAIVTGTAAGPLVGVLVDPSMIVVGVVGRAGHDAAAVTSRVREALKDLAAGIPVSVCVRSAASATAPCDRSLAQVLAAAWRGRPCT